MERRLQGRGDSPLTQTGRAQVSAHLEWLPGLAPERLISSPLGRARATADILATGTGLQPEFDDALCERCMGVFEGWTLEEIAAAHPAEYAIRLADPWHWRPPRGENYDDLLERTAPLVERLRAHPARCVLVVSHGTLMRTLVGQLLGLDRDTILRLRAPNDLAYHVDLGAADTQRIRHIRQGRWSKGFLLRSDDGMAVVRHDPQRAH